MLRFNLPGDTLALSARRDLQCLGNHSTSKRRMHGTTEKISSARVMIVDGHPLAACGLRRFLESETSHHIIADVRSSRDALEIVAAESPDIVILELLIGESNALNLVRAIRAMNPRTKVFVLSMLPEVIYAERALRAGALGYLEKKNLLMSIVVALRYVARNEIYMSTPVKQKLIRKIMLNPNEITDSTDVLTDSELSAFELIGRGLDLDALAQRLEIGNEQAALYHRSIKRKLCMQHERHFLDFASQWVQKHHC